MRASAVWINVVLGALTGVVCSAAHADDNADAASADEPAAISLVGAPVRFAAATAAAPSNAAPRLTRADSPAGSQRSAPGYRNETSELDYRWWATSGRADVGVGIGTLTVVSRSSGSIPGLADGGGSPLAGGALMLVGMRYRTSDRSALTADAASLHGSNYGGDTVGGKVGVEFKSASSMFNITYGGLGLHLSGDTRMTVKVRRGGLALTMKRDF